MRTLIIAMFCMSCFKAGAQEERRTTFIIGITGSIDQNYRILFENDDINNSSSVKKWRNEIETGWVGMSAGIQTGIVLSDRSEIHAGMTYSLHGYQTKWRDFGLTPVPEPNAPDEIRFRYRFHYVNIPIYFKPGMPLFGNEDFHLKIGLVNRLFIKEVQTDQQKFENDSIEELKTTSYDYNGYVLSGSLGFGYSAHFGESFRLDLGPKFEFDLTRIIDEPVYAHLWNLGLTVSLWHL